MTADTGTAEPDVARYNAYVEAVDVTEIEIARVLGERRAKGRPAESHFDLATAFQRAGDDVIYRYELRCTIVDDAPVELGHVETVVLVHTRAVGDAPDDVVDRFAATSGTTIAYPFLREVLASTAQRLGFPGVLLPLVKTTGPAPEPGDA